MGYPATPPNQPPGYPAAPPAQAPGYPAAPPAQPYAAYGQPYAPTPPAPAPTPPPHQQHQQQQAPGPFGAPAHSAGFQPTGHPPAGTPAPSAPPTLAKPEPGQAPPMPGGAPAPAYPPVPHQPGAYDTAGYQAPYDPTAPPPTRRGADSSSITTLLLNLPLFLGSFLVIWLISQLFPTGLDIVFVIAWLASGALMFHRPTERTLARFLYKVRQPTAAELARLQPLWDDVTRRAGLDGSRYDLWVEDSDQVNAFAAAGHIVSVTRKSLGGLPPEQLSAVLAHELGHHVGGHAWSGLLGVWYAFPARIVMYVVKFLVTFIFLVAAQIACLGALVFALVIGAIAVSLALTFPPALALFAVPVLLAWAGRAGELRADRFAAEIGYGPLLLATLTGWLDQGSDDDHGQQGVMARLMATHPPIHQRIRALEPFAYGPAGPAGPVGHGGPTGSLPS
ncbi:M48 family metalloprotease [Streptomyces sp. NPDC088762]|uniref:M48 family metalloprotease n=1 Tax=Streptomyces sp. NPDC088762 TaxID=3365891 RepID=UPI0038259C8E